MHEDGHGSRGGTYRRYFQFYTVFCEFKGLGVRLRPRFIRLMLLKLLEPFVSVYHSVTSVNSLIT
jgi:hypothetical protein